MTRAKVEPDTLFEGFLEEPGDYHELLESVDWDISDFGSMQVEDLPVPIVRLPDEVLFPNEHATLMFTCTDLSFRFVRQIDKQRPEPVIFQFPGEDDGDSGAVCGLGSVFRIGSRKNGPSAERPRPRRRVATARARSGGVEEVEVLVHARLGEELMQRFSRRPGTGSEPESSHVVSRNPLFSPFRTYADAWRLIENFEKLIYQFPGLPATVGTYLLDELESIKHVGRKFDEATRLLEEDSRRETRWEDDAEPARSGVQGSDEDEATQRNDPVPVAVSERPSLLLDVAADFIAVSLIREIPGLEVPFSLQKQWFDLVDPCGRARALNDFLDKTLDDLMTPSGIYERDLKKTIERYEYLLEDRTKDRPAQLRANGDKFLRQKLIDVKMQLNDPVARLRGRLDSCGMPTAVRAQLQPEVDRLSDKNTKDTMEYLGCLVALPWTGGKADTVDLQRAREVLDESHFGLREAKERILEYLAVRRRRRHGREPVLCFVGPPGVGKSSLAASIAEALGRGFANLSCNGMSLVSDVRGAQRHWAGAQPGRIIRQLQSVGARNPVFVLDELDKIQEAAGVALLDALDPTRNAAFHDLYLEVPFDLSEVFFIATANVLGRIPTALRNRLEVIEIRGYSEKDKLEVAKRILVPARIQDHGLTSDLIEFDDRALRAMIRDHAYELGLRALDRTVSAFCRKLVLQLETACDRKPAKVRVTKSMVGKLLGKQTGDGQSLTDIERFRAVIELGDLPAEVKREGKRELELLLTSSLGGSDYSDHLNILRWLTGVPWNAPVKTRIDLRRTRKLLEERHSGLVTAKTRILEYLAARKLGGHARGTILCFVGPPGVGKTSLARSIADAMGRKLAVVSCGGVADATEFVGFHRSWRGAQPGRIVRELSRIGVNNPVLVLDEIDKIQSMSSSWGGDPESALLGILDPAQNDRFADHYIEVPFDLSEVFFVATANALDMIAAPLRDRLEVIQLKGYSEEEKLQIAGSHLVARQLTENGLASERVRFTDGALRALISGYTHEAGVRDLERGIGAVCRKVALRWAEGGHEGGQYAITEHEVAKMLGAPRRVDAVVSDRMSRAGVAMGLSWTPMGGQALFVEVRRMRGDGTLTLTGNLGEVLKESAHAALSWVRANAARYGIDPGFHKNTDIHVHVPEGAVPKDGPSAGVTMAAALASELTGRTVRSDLAMTGELTLSGNVLAVGGVKEKVLAARRVGVAQVILPKQNEVEGMHEIHQFQCEIEVHYVSTIDEVLELALSPAVSG